MTRTEICEARVQETLDRLQHLEDLQEEQLQPEYPWKIEDAVRAACLKVRIACTREMLIAEEDHLEYARQHGL